MVAVLDFRDPEHHTCAVWLQHAESRSHRAAADRIEDQPKWAVRLGGGQLTTDDDAIAAPFGDCGTVAPYMSPHEGAGRGRELAGKVPDPA